MRLQILAMIGRGRHAESCSRKVRYGHQETAVRAQAAMKAKTGRMLDAYHCTHCEGWHLGNGLLAFTSRKDVQ